eukprot:1980463-Prymnesium_polylepis.1
MEALENPGRSSAHLRPASAPTRHATDHEQSPANPHPHSQSTARGSQPLSLLPCQPLHHDVETTL